MSDRLATGDTDEVISMFSQEEDITNDWSRRMSQEVNNIWFGRGIVLRGTTLDDETEEDEELNFEEEEESEEKQEYQIEESEEIFFEIYPDELPTEPPGPGDTDSEGYTARERAERDQQVVDAINSLKESTDPVTQANGNRLEAMFNSPERNVATAITQQFVGPEQINQLMAILNNPAQTRAANTLRQILPRIGDNFAAVALVDSLMSTDASTRNDGAQLLTMLNSEADSPLALALLNGIMIGPQERHKMLELLNTPAQAPTATALRNLLTSQNENEVRAGNRLLSLMTDTDPLAQRAARSILERLNNPDKRADAITLASVLNTPGEIVKVSEILDTPSQKTAARNIMRMLESEEQSDSAVRLLDLISGQFDVDRQQGLRLLGMLNDTEQAALAQRILDIPDVEYRNNILRLHLNATTAPAVPRILALRESTDRLDRIAYADLQYYLDSGDTQEQTIGRDLAQLLAGPATADLAIEILKKFKTPAEAAEMISIVKGASPQTLEGMRSLLTGSREDLSRLHKLIELRVGGFNYSDRDVKAELTKKPFTEEFRQVDQRPTANRLFEMLTGTDPEQRSAAQTLLDRVTNPTHIRPFLNLPRNSDKSKDAGQLLSMLASNDHQDRRGANILLEMLATDPPVPLRPYKEFDGFGGSSGGKKSDLGIGDGLSKAPADIKPFDDGKERAAFTQSAAQIRAVTLLAMLTNPAQRDAARNLLRVVNSPEDIQRLDAMRPDATRQSLITMLNNPAQESTARRILDSLDAGAATTMLTIVSDPSRRALADRLMQMLPESTSTVRSFLDNFTRATEQQLAQMLADPNRSYEAEQIMNSVPTRHQAQLLAMLNDPEQRAGARQVYNLFTSDAPEAVRSGPTLLEMMASQNETTSQNGRRLLSMLSGSETDRSRARLMLSTLSAPDQFRRLFSLIDGGQTHASNLMLEMLGSNEDRQARARYMLTARPGPGQPNDQLLQMLGNPAESALAFNMLNTLDPAQISRMMTIRNTRGQEELARTLGTLLNGSAVQRMNVRLLLQEGGNGARILSMLTTDATRNATQLALSTLNDADQIVALVNISNAQRPAYQQLQQMLSSGDTTQINQAKTLLQMVGRASSSGNQILQLLNTPSTANRARQILSAGSPLHAERLQQMLVSSSEQELGQQMLTMFNNPDHRSQASVLLMQLSNQEISRLFSITRNPATREAGEFLLSLLGDEDRGGITRRLLAMSESSALGGQRMLQMLNDPYSPDFETAMNLEQLGSNAGLFLDILQNPQHREAAGHLRNMIKPDEYGNPRAVNALLRLLSQSATQAEGQRILAMMSDSRHRDAAIRLLDNRVFANRPGDYAK